jgi:pantoate kinase
MKTFRTVRDATTDDLDRAIVAEISARTGLADVRAERAAGLVAGEVEAWDLRVVEVEVLITLDVGAKRTVVGKRREINGSALHYESAHERLCGHWK